MIPHISDEKYHLQNYPPQIVADQQHNHHYSLNQYKPIDHHQASLNSNHHSEKHNDGEPNNNSSKNTSSASSYDDAIDTIDYDDSIQNHDIKETSPKRSSNSAAITLEGENLKYKCNDFHKSFPNRHPYEDPHHQQSSYNGSAVSGNSNDDYRITTIDDRKLNEDGNSNDMRMNYASSDDMNQNAASSDHGDKMGSGSEDEGNYWQSWSIDDT